VSAGRTPRAAAREAGLFLAALAPCPVIALLSGGDRVEALARGRAIEQLERGLGLPSEPALHAWATQRPWLLSAAWVLYLFAHLPAVGGALVWAWLERPRAYRTARNVFLTAQSLTLAGYLLLPSAPPHLLPELGIGASPTGGSVGAAQALQSPWAAVPSGHIVFSLVAAGIVVALVSRPLVRGLALLYPPLMLAVTVLTANHFWFDAAASVLVVLAATAIVLAPRRAAGTLRRRSRRPAGAAVGSAPLPGGAAGLGD
jgi:PAP2 superfamily